MPVDVGIDPEVQRPRGRTGRIGRRRRAGHADPAGEYRFVREETGDFRHRVAVHAQDAHVRRASGTGARHHLHGAVAVDVGGADPHAAGERRFVGPEARCLDLRVAHDPEHADVRAAGGSRARDELVDAVPVEIAAGDTDAAGERRFVAPEARRPDERSARELEHPHVRAAGRTGAGDDLVDAIAVEVAGADVDAAGERRFVGVEAREYRERAAVVAERLNVRPASGTGARDDVADSVAVDVAHRHFHTAGEDGLVRVEARDLVQAARETERAHLRGAARARAGDDVGESVPVDVAARDRHAARERGIVGEETRELRHRAARQLQHAHMRTAAGSRAGDDLVDAVAVDIAARAPDRRDERRAVVRR